MSEIISLNNSIDFSMFDPWFSVNLTEKESEKEYLGRLRSVFPA